MYRGEVTPFVAIVGVHFVGNGKNSIPRDFCGGPSTLARTSGGAEEKKTLDPALRITDPCVLNIFVRLLFFLPPKRWFAKNTFDSDASRNFRV